MTTPILRNCKGCKTTKDRSELLKVTLCNDKLYLNPNSKIFGRSVYVCKNLDCIKKLIKSKGLRRGLKFNNDDEIKKMETALFHVANN